MVANIRIPVEFAAVSFSHFLPLVILSLREAASVLPVSQRPYVKQSDCGNAISDSEDLSGERRSEKEQESGRSKVQFQHQVQP